MEMFHSIRFKVKVFLIAVSLLFAVLCVQQGSRLQALYHYEQGARLLGHALELEKGKGEEKEGGVWLNPLPLTKNEARSLALQALTHFKQAMTVEPTDFHVHRWLGRNFLLLGDQGKAIEHFSKAVQQRPDNPLAWWELGAAYESLFPNQVSSYEIFFSGEYVALGDKPTTSEDILSYLHNSDPTLSIVHWSMPDASEAWAHWWVPANPISRKVLSVRKPFTLTLGIYLPAEPTTLTFWMGLGQQDMSRAVSEKATYRLRVNGAEVFSRTLDVRPAEEGGWWPGQVDLSPWISRQVSLTLFLDPGTASQAFWGDPQVIPSRLAQCYSSSCLARARRAWERAGFSAADFIKVGREGCIGLKCSVKGLKWFVRAALMEPSAAEPAYYAGLVFLSQSKWLQAQRLLEQALSRDPGLAGAYIALANVRALGFADLGQAMELAGTGAKLIGNDPEMLAETGRFYFHVGEYKLAEHYLREALSYDSSNLYFLLDLGHSLFAQSRFTEALEVYKEASWIRTYDWQEAMAHVALGQTYLSLGMPAYAIREFTLATQLHPQDSDNFVRLGDAFLASGEKERALEAYRLALRVDSGNKAAHERITTLRK